MRLYAEGFQNCRTVHCIIDASLLGSEVTDGPQGLSLPLPPMVLPGNNLAEYWRTNCHMFKKIEWSDLPNSGEKDFRGRKNCVLRLFSGGTFNEKAREASCEA